MEPVLVSACLLGEAVRFDGGDMRSDHAILQRWLKEGRVVSVCPEVAGGLPVPRPRAEIAAAAGGANVLSGHARAFDSNGRDVSAWLVNGAECALAKANEHGIRVAVLKEGSPSCGSGFIFDGSFSNAKADGMGVTAALLTQNGVKVFSEHQLAEADTLLSALEARGPA